MLRHPFPELCFHKLRIKHIPVAVSPSAVGRPGRRVGVRLLLSPGLKLREELRVLPGMPAVLFRKIQISDPVIVSLEDCLPPGIPSGDCSSLFRIFRFFRSFCFFRLFPGAAPDCPRPGVRTEQSFLRRRPEKHGIVGAALGHGSLRVQGVRRESQRFAGLHHILRPASGFDLHDGQQRVRFFRDPLFQGIGLHQLPVSVHRIRKYPAAPGPDPERAHHAQDPGQKQQGCRRRYQIVVFSRLCHRSVFPASTPCLSFTAPHAAYPADAPLCKEAGGLPLQAGDPPSGSSPSPFSAPGQ